VIKYIYKVKYQVNWDKRVKNKYFRFIARVRECGKHHLQMGQMGQKIRISAPLQDLGYWGK